MTDVFPDVMNIEEGNYLSLGFLSDEVPGYNPHW